MRYKVPQNVQRADQILWFLTLPQLILLIVGFGISYWLFTTLNKIFVLDEVSQVLVWIPGAIAAAFAFVKIKGIPLFKFILLLFEQNMFRPPRRRWSQHGGTPFVSMTTPFSKTVKKAPQKVEPKKNVSSEKIKNIAAILDSPQK